MVPEMSLTRLRIELRGSVHGVGLRPFAHGLATRLGLAGRVGDDGGGAYVEVEGDPQTVVGFCRTLLAEPPPRALIEAVTVRTVPVTGSREFAAGPAA